MKLSIFHRREIQSRFTSALNMMGTADVYWTPGGTYPIFRQIDELRIRRRKANKLPVNAVHLGRYKYGATSMEFMDDLAIFLDALETPAPTGQVGDAARLAIGATT